MPALSWPEGKLQSLLCIQEGAALVHVVPVSLLPENPHQAFMAAMWHTLSHWPVTNILRFQECLFLLFKSTLLLMQGAAASSCRACRAAPVPACCSISWHVGS